MTTAQRLPLPLGSPHPVRTSSRPWQRRTVDGTGLVLIGAGLLAGIGGAWLGVSPPPARVWLDAQGYHLGSVTLVFRGGGVYTSAAGALVILWEPDTTRAGAATHLDGARMLGSCTMHQGAEECSFLLAGVRVEAQDRLRTSGWDRRYGDGRTVRIELGRGPPVPVPFALGR